MNPLSLEGLMKLSNDAVDRSIEKMKQTGQYHRPRFEVIVEGHFKHRAPLFDGFSAKAIGWSKPPKPAQTLVVVYSDQLHHHLVKKGLGVRQSVAPVEVKGP